MTQSLADAIFGSTTSTVKSTSEAKDKKTQDLFSSSADLPERPNKVNFHAPSKKKTETTSTSASPAVDKTPRSTKKKDRKKKRGEELSEEKKKDGSETTNTTTNNEETKTSNKDENDTTPTTTTSNDDTPETTVPQEDEDERTIFVGNLPLNITRKRLTSLFQSCGKVLSARIRSLPTAGIKLSSENAGNQNLAKKVSANTHQILQVTPKKTSQGYVVFASSSSVEKALKLNNQIIIDSDANGGKGETRRLRVDRCNATIDSTRSVFVGNLPYAADETSLRQHFMLGCGWEEENGVNTDVEEGRDGSPSTSAVEGVRIIRDPETMQCKGIGYVLLRNKSLVPEALKMQGSQYLKRTIRVSVCGKRFKGRRGKAKEEMVESSGSPNKRSFEGIRATSGNSSITSAKRRVMNKSKNNGDVTNDNYNSLTKSTLLTMGTSIKKKRGTKKVGIIKKGGRNGGISKRVATDKKLDKRMKKIQKRVARGMGKNKK